MKLTVCKKCNRTIVKVGFTYHLRQLHNMTGKEYYDIYTKQENEGICKTCGKETGFKSVTKGYNEFCSAVCRHVYLRSDKTHTKTCLVCGMELSANTFIKMGMIFKTHLKLHGLSPQKYYDAYIKKEGEGICKQCGKPTKFRSLQVGYYLHCSRECNCLSVRQKNKLEHKIVTEIRQDNIIAHYAHQDTVEEFQNHLKENAASYDTEKKILYYAVETSPICLQKFDTEVTWS